MTRSCLGVWCWGLCIPSDVCTIFPYMLKRAWAVRVMSRCTKVGVLGSPSTPGVWRGPLEGTKEYVGILLRRVDRESSAPSELEVSRIFEDTDWPRLSCASAVSAVFEVIIPCYPFDFHFARSPYTPHQQRNLAQTYTLAMDSAQKPSRLAETGYISPYSRSGAPGPHPNGDVYGPLRSRALATLEAMGFDPELMAEHSVLWAEHQVSCSSPAVSAISCPAVLVETIPRRYQMPLVDRVSEVLRTLTGSIRTCHASAIHALFWQQHAAYYGILRRCSL